MNRRAVSQTLPMLISALGLLLASCSQHGSSAVAASIPPPITLSGLPSPTAQQATTSAATTEPATTTTEPPTTTTEAPTTTTEPPTTTEAPTTTTVPLASNVEAAPPADQPLEAVGGHSGAATALVQARLLQLGFWNSGADGNYGFTTTQAVMAFQKYIGLPPSGKVDQPTADYLTSFAEKAHASADTGTLVEVDKAKQLLFIVQDGKTQWTFNTSTGSGIAYEAVNKNDPTKIETGDAQTPEGLFHTTRERPEGWWDGDLGKIYRPKYFSGGVAVHGMTVVPGHPASHGCVRLSTQAMDFIWDQNLMPLHIVVWVHS
jgi:L,D-transpeptidase catalytic domain/Putative peptidoglycan binding domain